MQDICSHLAEEGVSAFDGGAEACGSALGRFNLRATAEYTRTTELAWPDGMDGLNGE
jgi:hypothetical protein